MVHKSSIIPGLSKFIDESILVHYPPSSMKRIIIASGVSLYLKENEGVIDTLVSNPLFATLGVVNSSGMVDIDKLRETLKSEISKAGFMRLTLPVIGDIDFTTEDIDTLYRYISEANNMTQKPTVQQIPGTTTLINGGVY